MANKHLLVYIVGLLIWCTSCISQKSFVIAEQVEGGDDQDRNVAVVSNGEALVQQQALRTRKTTSNTPNGPLLCIRDVITQKPIDYLPRNNQYQNDNTLETVQMPALHTSQANSNVQNLRKSVNVLNLSIKGLTASNNLVETGLSGADTDKYKNWRVVSKGLSTVIPILSFISIGLDIWSGVSDGNMKQFQQVFAALNQINKNIVEGFLMLQVTMADIVLDDIMTSLQAISIAYQHLQDAANATFSLNYGSSYDSFLLRKTYANAFRNACNAPHRSPEDLFFDLYGYGCSNCTLAQKKRQNIASVYEQDARNDLTTFEQFSNWLLFAMFQARMLHMSCLRPLESSCINPLSMDTVFLKTNDKMQVAFDEVVDRFEVIAKKFRKDPTRVITKEWLREKTMDVCVKNGKTDTHILHCVRSTLKSLLDRNSTFQGWEWAFFIFNCGNMPTKDDMYHKAVFDVKDSSGKKWYSFYFMFHKKGMPLPKTNPDGTLLKTPKDAFSKGGPCYQCYYIPDGNKQGIDAIDSCTGDEVWKLPTREHCYKQWVSRLDTGYGYYSGKDCGKYPVHGSTDKEHVEFRKSDGFYWKVAERPFADADRASREFFGFY